MDNGQSVDNSNGNPNNTQVDEVYEVINMGDKEPLNDPNCQHENVIEDKTEELGRAFQCADCKIGWIVAR